MKKEPLILNIESSTGKCSVCLSKGFEMVAFEEADEAFQHSKLLTQLIGLVLKKGGIGLNQLDAIAVGAGPGSYTSLRVGASTAKGICYALDKPLIKVDTLRSLAMAACNEIGKKEAIYCPMIDARRMEAYFNLYDGKGNSLSEPMAKVIDSQSFDGYFKNGKTIVFCGNGAEKFGNTILNEYAIFHPLECSALFMPELSIVHFQDEIFEDVAYFSPLYLKPPNITISKKRIFERV